jgi:hypothetical protein
MAFSSGVLLFLCVLAVAAPARGQSRAELESQARQLHLGHEALDRDSAQALEALLGTTRRDVATRRQEIAVKLKAWTEDLSDASIADINRQIQEALPLARASGLDVDRLTRIYELTRTVVRTADFPPPRETNPVLGSTLAQRTADMFLWAIGEEQVFAEAEQRHQQYRVDLYKRVMLAYLRALLATPLPPPDGCAPGPSRAAIVRGVQVPLVDCPDPVVAGLRAYLDAVRTLQSADSDALIATAEELVAEQQLVADIAAGIPLVGDALDIYAVWSGEDLAGSPMSPGMRAFSALMVLVPNVGPFAWEQAMARSPSARAAAEVVAAYWEAASSTAGVIVEVYVRETRAIASDMAQGIARRWNTTVAQLDEMLQGLRRARRSAEALTEAELDQLRIYQNLRDAAQDRIDLDALPAAYRKRASDSAAHRAARTIGRAQAERAAERVAQSGLVPHHAEIFADVARESREIVIVRPVNRDAAALIDLGWDTKNMGVKMKSADFKAIGGSIPVNQALNKNGTLLRQAEEKLIAAEARGAEKAVTDALRAEVAEMQAKLAKGREALQKCYAKVPPCAIEIPHPNGVLEATDAAGRPILVLPDGGGGFIDAMTDNPVRPHSTPQPVKILADPVTGKPLTADYDLLATGNQGPLVTPRFDAERGFITEQQKQLVADINERVKRKAEDMGREGANVVHHGAEQNFPGSPGVDYPLTAFQPSGEIVNIPACDEACMRHWCTVSGLCDPDMVGTVIAIDPHRLAKDYFHDMRHKGFNLYPNPAWRWGPWNALGGWLPFGGNLPTRVGGARP